MTYRLAVISGGLSSPSSSRLLADRLAAAAVRRASSDGGDAEVFLVELRDLAHSITNALLTGFAAGDLAAAQRLVAGSDGLIVVTPTFNASYSGLFKSFFDTLDDGLVAGMPVIIAATGGTERHSLVLDHALRPLFAYLGAVVLPTGVYAASSDWASASADGLDRRIDRAAGELSKLLAGQPAARSQDPFANVAPFSLLSHLEKGKTN